VRRYWLQRQRLHRPLLPSRRCQPLRCLRSLVRCFPRPVVQPRPPLQLVQRDLLSQRECLLAQLAA